jgi:hypothetical protein
MSVTHLRVNTFDTAGTSFTTSSFTPTIGDSVFMYIGYARDIVNDNPSVTDSLGGTWTPIGGNGTFAHTDNRRVIRLYVRDAIITAATAVPMTATYNNGGGNTCASCALGVFAITGVTKTGSAVRRQGYTGHGENGGTPSTYFNPDNATPCLATNVVLVAICNGANPATMSPPSGFTELQDIGVTPPVSPALPLGLEYAYVLSGYTGANAAWTSTTATDAGCLGTEIDMSVGTALSIQALPRTFAVSTKIASIFPTVITGGSSSRDIKGDSVNFKHRVAFKRPFLLVNSSDGKTGATGKTPAVTISKNGAAFAAPIGTTVELSNGWYVFSGTIADADTPGPLAMHATASGANTEDHLDFIEDDGIWRSKVTGAATATSLIDSALVQSAANTWKGRVIIAMTGAADGQASNIDGFDPATDKLTFTAMPTTMAVGDDYWIV